MTTENVNGIAWEQLAFDEPPAYEINVRVGIVPDGGHAQIQIECHDVVLGEPVVLISWPHLDPLQLEVRLPEVLDEFYALLRRYTGPFP